MKWTPARNEPATWLLTRKVILPWPSEDCVGSVHALNADLKRPALRNPFMATVNSRSSGKVFVGLKAAQLWCEQEVRLMEVGELV